MHDESADSDILLDKFVRAVRCRPEDEEEDNDEDKEATHAEE